MSRIKSKVDQQNIAEAFWRPQLQPFNAPTPFQVDKRRTSRTTDAASYAELHYILPKALSARLTTFAQTQQLTLGTLVQGAWALLLGRYSGNSEVLFGRAVSEHSPTVDGQQRTVGLLNNTMLPVAVVLPSEQAVLPWLQTLQQSQITAQQYAYVSLSDLQSWSGVPHGMQLFESILLFETSVSDSQQDTRLSGMLQAMERHKQSDYPLTIAVISNAELSFTFSYNIDRFDAATIERMAGHLQTLLAGIVADPNQSLSELPLLTKAERHQLLVEWNDTATDYPKNKCIHHLFEEQAARTPEAVAVVFEDQQLTYGELNARANQLAHYLINLGIGPEVLVGICVERSVEMMVGLLGILKAGGAYVPLDVIHPEERLAFMLSDTSISVLLTQKKLLSKFSASFTTFCLDLAGEILATQSVENLKSAVTTDSLAYIMYTSGSTGQPKGVCVTQRNVVRLVQNTNFAQLTEQEVWLQLAPISFDASTLEIWGALLNGAKLVIMPPQQVSLEELGQAISQHQITTLWLTAGLFHLMVDEQLENLRSLRQLLAGGDVLSVLHVQKVLAELPDCQLINGYGPTENTTFTSCFPIIEANQIGVSVPIGRPIANTQVYILDNTLQPVPVGVVGELYAGGDGVARGYHNQPELTSEKFVANPYGAGCLYKTGDLARWLPASRGNIEFLGRIDHQVKIRGFRIELGEIEAVLSQLPAVQEAVVIAREDTPSQKRLVAYVVECKETPDDLVTPEALRKHLERKLPDYMVPAAFVILHALPLTPNGKVDRKALPAPTTTDLGIQLSAEAPDTVLTSTLATIWQELLRLEAVGLDDNFFNIGGNSIISMQLVRRARQAGLRITPLQLIQNPTIRKLARSL